MSAPGAMAHSTSRANGTTSAQGTAGASGAAARAAAVGMAGAHARDSLPPMGDGLRIRHGALRRGGGDRRGGHAVLGAGMLRAPGGAVVALVGENGAGKSTLLMAAAGVLLGARAGGGRAGGGRGGDAGEGGASAVTVTLDGHAMRAVSYLPQRPTLPSWLTVRQSAALHGASAPLLHDAAARLGMTSLLDRRAGALSGGQLQALVAAIVLARPEPVVLLDEPFTAVDLARRPVLRQLVAERAARVPRGVVVLSSHVAADLAALCDWVVVLRDGGYAWQGPTRALAHGASALPDGGLPVGDLPDVGLPDGGLPVGGPMA
ncbi:MAG TPA: ATP-binding cassette domain-containing protein, partial [Gemmatimonadaceae bacterium]|nr:ATP-binding cassette domain-containing protein [Gemmatimonadaceae bacterium]